MGSAAYNRGSALIRRQTDEEMPKRDRLRDIEEAMVDRLAILQSTADSLASDLIRAKKLIARLRAEKAVLRNELADCRDNADMWHKQACLLQGSLATVIASWRKASALLRLLPTREVQRLQKLRDMHQRKGG